MAKKKKKETTASRAIATLPIKADNRYTAPVSLMKYHNNNNKKEVIDNKENVYSPYD